MNPNCDGSKCRSVSGEVRLLPLPPLQVGGWANLIVCRDCYVYEMVWRRERNRRAKKALFDLPEWTDLEVYGGAL